MITRTESAGTTVLVAGDDPVARDLLAEVLSNEGYQVVTVPSSDECVRRLERQPFDVLLLDLRLSDADGVRLLQRLRAQYPELAIVMVITFASVEAANEAIGAGASDCLSKPFRMREIPLVVRRAMDIVRSSL